MGCSTFSFRVGVVTLALAAPLLAGALGAASAVSQASALVLAQAQPQPQPRPPARGSARQSGRETSGDDAQGRPVGDAQLRQRVEQLETQLTEMQVVIGTLESLARPGAVSGAPLARSAGEGDQGRIEDLETQVRALTNQLEQLSEQVRQLGGRRTDLGSPGMTAGREAPPDRPPFGGPSASEARGWADAHPSRDRSGGGSFGSVTVTPGPEGDPIGRLITPERGSDRMAAATTDAARVGNPKELYETAYGYLLQQDYASAEASFEEFLRLYAKDRLAADAQYWLGEALYVQQRYKPAGQAFLKVIQNHQSSAKVPNSLLKLAMTLEQLGQKDCALFNELDTRHPNAAADVKNRARVVRQRVGC